MLKLEEYLKSPCGTSSLPYWKLIKFPVPENMLVVHNDLFYKEYLLDYDDKPYFRLLHDLSVVPQVNLDKHFILHELKPDKDAQIIAELINSCYRNITVSAEQVLGWSSTKVFRRDLWIGVINRANGELAAAGIADFDKKVREGMLEWIQVLPKYQRHGLGAFIVAELLARLKSMASFVTVSGELDNKSHPEMLYRHCGFTGTDIWHILSKKNH